MMILFTFITEVGGSTVVEQFRAPTLRLAIARWNTESQTEPRVDKEYLGEADPQRIEGTRGVWCFGKIGADDRFYLVNIVQTSES